MNNPEIPFGCIECCPACPHRHLTMNQSLAQKGQWLRQRLSGFDRFLEPVRGVTEDQRWHYRQKVCLAAEFIDGNWKIGIRQRDQVIAIHHCPVQHEHINRNIQLIATTMPPATIFPLAYFMQSGRQITLVIKSRALPPMDWLKDLIRENLAANGVEGFWLHLHPSSGKKVLGKGGWHLIFGQPTSMNDEGAIYGPSSFQQVLLGLYHESIQSACDYLAPNAGSLVIDLYSGIGLSLRQWAGHGADTTGVEISGEALECASANVPSAKLLRGSCAQRIPQLNEVVNIARKSGKDILLYVNPPRTGLEKEVASWIATELKPSRIAYLSCSAGTLHRDLLFLKSSNFCIEKILPFDFFPNTLHIETLALIRGNDVV